MRISIVVVGLLMLGCSYAVELPPGVPFDSVDWPALSSFKPTAGFRLGDFNILYEKTSLAEIKGKIGSGRIDHNGDAAESVYWICYTAQQERIWIMSGEMGGSENAVLNVAVESGKFEENTDCPVLPGHFQSISFDHGLRIGVTEKSTIEALGAPSHREGAWLSFDFAGKENDFCKPSGADVTNWCFLKIENGRVVSIRAGQVTSC